MVPAIIAPVAPDDHQNIKVLLDHFLANNLVTPLAFLVQALEHDGVDVVVDVGDPSGVARADQ